MYIMLLRPGDKVKYIGTNPKINHYLEYMVMNTHYTAKQFSIEINGVEDKFPVEEFVGKALFIDIDYLRNKFVENCTKKHKIKPLDIHTEEKECGSSTFPKLKLHPTLFNKTSLM